MPIKLGIIMDPIQDIHFKKDTSLALLLEAKKRNWDLWYMEEKDLFIKQGKVYANMLPLIVNNNPEKWYEFPEYTKGAIEASELDVILMRKDPPVDQQFIYTTQLLDLVEKEGTLVVNKPQSIRDFNEKLAVSWFPQCCPPNLVTSNIAMLSNFAKEHKQIVLKSLDSLGGCAVYKIKSSDNNFVEVIENVTLQGTLPVMAQKYIPEIIKHGDKRILLINGKPFPYGLARIPAKGDFRGNLAVGAQGVGVPLTDNDYWICEQVGPMLKEKKLIFVGLDVIGNYITEINVTSPTCVQEIIREHGENAGTSLLDCIEELLTQNIT